jgi:hypothetical protein
MHQLQRPRRIYKNRRIYADTASGQQQSAAESSKAPRLILFDDPGVVVRGLAVSV